MCACGIYTWIKIGVSLLALQAVVFGLEMAADFGWRPAPDLIPASMIGHHVTCNAARIGAIDVIGIEGFIFIF